MSGEFEFGALFVRDMGPQTDDIAKLAIDLCKRALGHAWDREPELREAYARAAKMSVRGVLRVLAGEDIPVEWWKGVSAQFGAVSLKTNIASGRVAFATLWRFIHALAVQLTALGGQKMASVGKCARGFGSGSGPF
jgi:hypothetical protein